MNRRTRTDFASKDFDGDFPQALSTQALVEVFQTHLRVATQNGRKLAEKVLVARSVVFQAIGQCTQAIGAFALFTDLGRERAVLVLERRCRGLGHRR